MRLVFVDALEGGIIVDGASGPDWDLDGYFLGVAEACGKIGTDFADYAEGPVPYGDAGIVVYQVPDDWSPPDPNRHGLEVFPVFTRLRFALKIGTSR